MKNFISVIIPFKENFESLEKVLQNLMSGDVVPNEVIIIDTSIKNLIEKQELISRKFNKIKFINAPGAFPGEARNIGIDNSNHDLIGFLDTRTIPPLNWLSSSLDLLVLKKNIFGVYGKTEYFASHEKSKLIKYATYGMNPLTTVPGMLIKREAIIKVGNFLPTTRAGEDADWMIRLSLQRISMEDPKSVVMYYGLDEFGFIYLFLKWFRNYKHSSKLPYLNAHKSIYYHCFVLSILLLAFNWNWFAAGWDVENFLYVPHITKICLLLTFSLYAFIRGLVLPYRKGVELSTLIPFKWFFITLISFFLDFAKMCGFFAGSLYRK